jgi:8-oxo-dGTP pyrophosphatase MutT (NUDIX family)
MSEGIRIERVDALDHRVEPRPWAWAEVQRTAIEAHWRRRLAEKPQMFDGEVLLQHGGEIVEDGGTRTYRGRWLVTRFSAFLAWREFGMPDKGVRNVFSMAALRSADGAYLLGEMGAHTANAGRIYFPAGTPDPEDVVGDRLDLEGSVTRELVEETGLPLEELRLAPDWTLVIDGQMTACMKIVDMDMRAEAIVTRVARNLAAQDEPELARLVAVRGPGDFLEGRMAPFMIAYLERMLG